MRNKVLHNISGGAMYGYAMAKASRVAQDYQSADIFSGVSVGIWIALYNAIYGKEYMEYVSGKIDGKKAYKYIPFTPQGKRKLMTTIRIACGKPPADQDSRALTREWLFEEDWKAWKDSEDAPDCYCLTSNIEKGIPVVWNLKTDPENFDDLVDNIIEAGLRMQGMTDPVLLRGDLHWDGGQHDISMASHIIKLRDDIKECTSIFSSPKNWKPKRQDLKKKGYLDRLSRMIGLDNIDKVRMDRMDEMRLCDQKGILYRSIHTKRTLNHSFDTSSLRQQQAIDSAIESAHLAFAPTK